MQWKSEVYIKRSKKGVVCVCVCVGERLFFYQKYTLQATASRNKCKVVICLLLDFLSFWARRLLIIVHIPSSGQDEPG